MTGEPGFAGFEFIGNANPSSLGRSRLLPIASGLKPGANQKVIKPVTLYGVHRDATAYHEIGLSAASGLVLLSTANNHGLPARSGSRLPIWRCAVMFGGNISALRDNLIAAISGNSVPDAPHCNADFRTNTLRDTQ